MIGLTRVGANRKPETNDHDIRLSARIDPHRQRTQRETHNDRNVLDHHYGVQRYPPLCNADVSTEGRDGSASGALVANGNRNITDDR